MTVLYSQELEIEGFTVFCVSPGVSANLDLKPIPTYF